MGSGSGGSRLALGREPGELARAVRSSLRPSAVHHLLGGPSTTCSLQAHSQDDRCWGLAASSSSFLLLPPPPPPPLHGCCAFAPVDPVVDTLLSVRRGFLLRLTRPGGARITAGRRRPRAAALLYIVRGFLLPSASSPPLLHLRPIARWPFQ